MAKQLTNEAPSVSRVDSSRPTTVVTPLVSGSGRYHLDFDIEAEGMMVAVVTCSRPLRLWIGHTLCLNESLYWRLFNRRLYCAAAIPVSAGRCRITYEIGERPRHNWDIDRDCPSRNREKLMSELERQIPDELALEIQLLKGQVGPAAGFRFTPTQFRKEGVTYQEVVVRPLGYLFEPPTTQRLSAVTAADIRLDLRSDVMPMAGLDRTREQDANEGVRRFFVPIWAPGSEHAPLRKAGEENRLEPAHDIVDRRQLTIGGSGDEITLSMPVFESTGRLAARREYREIKWPTEQELRRSVPGPVLPPQYGHFRNLYDASWRMFLELVRTPARESGVVNPYVATGASFGLYQFVWDSSFTATCMAYGWRTLDAHANLDNLYSRQFDGGYIHREHSWIDGLPHLYEPDFSPNPPIMSIAEWQIARLSGDLLRVRQAYPVLKQHHQWLWQNRRLPDGTFWTTGLANGLDNSPSLGDGYPCLSAQMAHDAEILAYFARLLGHESDAVEFDRQREQVSAAVNDRLWDDSVGIYATSLRDGGHNPNKVVTAFWPLWAGIVPSQRIGKLAEHLKDPKSFWRHHPIPSLAADSPSFKPDGDYWRGSTWAPTNYAAIKGFDRAGRHDLAVETTLRHLQCMSEVLEKTGQIWENYCSESSLRGNWSGSPYCWSALGPIALLLEVLIGIEPDAMARTIRWTVPSIPGLGVRNYPLGPATISLVRSADELEVHTDMPFTLILPGAKLRTIKCPAGRRTVPLE